MGCGNVVVSSCVTLGGTPGAADVLLSGSLGAACGPHGRCLESPGGLGMPCFHAVFLSGLKVGCASKGAGNVVFGRTPMFDIGMRTTMLLHMGVYVRLWRHHIA